MTDDERAALDELGPELEYMLRCGHNDAGNSRRFTRRNRGLLIYALGPGWHRWTGQYWQAVPEKELQREGKRVAKKIWNEVLAIDDDKQRASKSRWAVTSGNESRINGMIHLAAAGEFAPGDQPDLKLDGGAAALDTNKNILNTPSGVVDLRTGELRDHEDSKDEYCTRITRVGYDAEASVKAWDEWLAGFWPDKKLRETLKKLAGASVTGHQLKVVPMLIGESDTGKSTLVEVVRLVLGGYGGTALESTFTNANSREAGYDLAEMRGVRFVVFSETRDGYGLANERIKRVTGGEAISARAPYGKAFSYKPSFTLWMSTNFAPQIAASDSAMWRRVRAIPCEHPIPRGKQINDYAETLVQEHGPGILRWLVEGARDFYASGSRPPQPTEKMIAFAARWRNEGDVVARWIAERTEDDPKARERFAQVWSDFENWLDDEGEEDARRRYTAQRFHRELDDKGYKRSEKPSKGGHVRYGLRLLPRS